MPLGSPLSASRSGHGEELAKQPLARTFCSLPSPALLAGRDGLKRSHGKNKGCLQSPRGSQSALWTAYHRGKTSSWRPMQEFSGCGVQSPRCYWASWHDETTLGSAGRGSQEPALRSSLADGEILRADLHLCVSWEPTVLRDLGGQPFCQPSQKLGGIDTPGLPSNAGCVLCSQIKCLNIHMSPVQNRMRLSRTGCCLGRGDQEEV